MFIKWFNKKQNNEKGIVQKILNEHPLQLDTKAKEEWRKEYIRISESLVEINLNEAEKFDKGLLTLSSIFLGFTLTFVDKIVPFNQAWYKWLLYSSWILFFLSIVAVFASLLFSMRANIQMDEGARKLFIEQNINYSNFHENTLNKIANGVNYFSFFFFVLGAGVFLLFVLLNVNILHK
jgi:hypothetical protein